MPSPASVASRASPSPGGRVIGQRIVGPQRTQPVGPFHQHDGIQRILPVQFGQRIGPIQPPQIVVKDRTNFRVVDLHQGEGRAGHLHRRIVRRRAQERPGQRGLAGAQRTFQQDAVARRAPASQARGQRFGRGKIGQGNDRTAASGI